MARRLVALVAAACIGGSGSDPGPDGDDKTAVDPPDDTATDGVETGAPTETTPTGPDRVEDAAPADFLAGTLGATAADAVGLTLPAGVAAGTFRSRVFDAGRPVRITAIEWLPDAPYGKALPDGGAEAGYPGGGLDLAGAALVLHLDDLVAPVADGDRTADTSGQAHDVRVVGGGGVTDGVLGGAYDDALGSWLRVPIAAQDALQFGAADLTWSYWVRSAQACAGNVVHLGAEEVVDDASHVWLGCTPGAQGGVAGGTLRPAIGDERSYAGATPIDDGAWHHVALVKAGHAAATLSVYVDGALEGVTEGALVAPVTFAGADFGIGAFSGGTYPAQGAFDEVAVVAGRAWSADAVADAFRRARTGLVLSVRACAEADCGDEPPFAGPSVDGPDNLVAPVVVAEPGGGVGRYVQYEAVLTSAAPTVAPRVRRVALHLAAP